MNENDVQYRRRRKWFGALSLVLLAIIVAFLAWFFTDTLSPYLKSPEDLRTFLDSYGWKGHFILAGIQFVQVMIPFFPGEVIEFGAGYAYGAVEGTLICLIGLSVSSSLIFILVKKVGQPLVEIFISREKMQQLRFMNDEKRIKRIVFWLFFIPGTPKDMFTYFIGLTNIRLSDFLLISLTARIPSLISSTVCGQMTGDRDYVTAVIVFAITSIFSVAGYILYNRYLKKKQENDI